MVALRSLQRRRMNRKTKRRTYVKRGGRPNRDSPNIDSLSRGSPSALMRSESSLLRELEGISVPTTPPKPSYTKAMGKKEAKSRLKFRRGINKLFDSLNKTVKDQYVGPPHFTVEKLWTDKWQEIMTEMDSMAKTLAVVRGKADTYYTNEGTMGFKMRKLKGEHEELMKNPRGSSKRTKKKNKPTKKKKKMTKGKKKKTKGTKKKTKGTKKKKKKTKGKRVEGGGPMCGFGVPCTPAGHATEDATEDATEAMRQELSRLKVSELKKRAKKLHVSEEELDAAGDADNVKAALVDLYIDAQYKSRVAKEAEAAELEAAGRRADAAAARAKEAREVTREYHRRLLTDYNAERKKYIERYNRNEVEPDDKGPTYPPELRDSDYVGIGLGGWGEIIEEDDRKD